MSYDENTGNGMTESDHRGRRLDAEIEHYKCPGMTNGELAELLSADLRPMFWRRELDIFFAKELGE